MDARVDLSDLQKEIYGNKVAKGFNITDVSLEFCHLYGELAEAFDVYRKKLPNRGEELADVAIYLLGLAEILKIDLEKEVMLKVAKNARREYQPINGTNVRTKDA